MHPKRNATTLKPGDKIARKEIDYAMLDNLIAIFCTEEEAAAVLDIDATTLNERIKEKYGMPFSAYHKKKNRVGKASLRRRQFELSKTNPALAIWLGKQYLDQKDKAEVHEEGNKTITFKYVN